MKRDMDLIRKILIAIEAHSSAELDGPPEIEGVGLEVIGEHLVLLMQAGYVDAVRLECKGMPDQFAMVRLTWCGHDFLASIRDPEIWKMTKDGAAKMGSWTVAMIGELAKGYIKQKAQTLGLPIG